MSQFAELQLLILRRLIVDKEAAIAQAYSDIKTAGAWKQDWKKEFERLDSLIEDQILNVLGRL